jgi:D-3-phosphoglycerate dehydrogenase / 2-oxoglutarate reductase
VTAPRVVVTDFDYPDLDIERGVLESAGIDLESHHIKEGPELQAIVAEADGVIVQYARITRHVLDAMRRCRVIARYGVGLDTIDQPAAGERGIRVHNVPDYCTEEVADHAMALMLSLLRGTYTLANEVAAGRWSLASVRPLHRIRGQTLGLIGCGRIGSAVAVRAAGFGMRVIGFDPLLDSATLAERGIQAAPFERVLAEADVLSLHRPAALEAPPALGSDEFARVKPGVVLINTARGSLIDERALREAVLDDRVRAAGLDVLHVEPPGPESLASLPGVIVTPHAAWYSEESEVQLRTTVATLVRDAVLVPPAGQ